MITGIMAMIGTPFLGKNIRHIPPSSGLIVSDGDFEENPAGVDLSWIAAAPNTTAAASGFRLNAQSAYSKQA